MLLDIWGEKHGVNPEAIQELKLFMGYSGTEAAIIQGESESAIQARVRLKTSQLGWRFWRNNVGAVQTEDGRFIRYGLANDSRRMNSSVKSGDLIGIRPLLIKPEHVGHTIGQFGSIEVKRAGWKFTGNDRETAQGAWCNLITSLGGYSKFSTGEV